MNLSTCSETHHGSSLCIPGSGGSGGSSVAFLVGRSSAWCWVPLLCGAVLPLLQRSYSVVSGCLCLLCWIYFSTISVSAVPLSYIICLRALVFLLFCCLLCDEPASSLFLSFFCSSYLASLPLPAMLLSLLTVAPVLLLCPLPPCWTSSAPHALQPRAACLLLCPSSYNLGQEGELSWLEVHPYEDT